MDTWVELKHKVIARGAITSVLPVSEFDPLAVDTLPLGTTWADATSESEWASSDVLLFVGDVAVLLQLDSVVGMEWIHEYYAHVKEIVTAGGVGPRWGVSKEGNISNLRKGFAKTSTFSFL